MQGILKEHTIPAIITWMRIPLQSLEGCSYDSSTSLINSENDFENGEFSNSIISTKDGQDMSCAWDINTLEKNLIAWGIVDDDILQNKEIL